MHARYSYLVVDSGKIDDMLTQLREEQLPRLKELEGYKGFTVHADRESGQVVGVSYWESEDALQASEEAGDQARRAAAETAGASNEPRVQRFEVLFDDMA